MKKFFIFVLFVLSSFLFAQTSGKVYTIDNNGNIQPVLLAQIRFCGKNDVAYSNYYGEYSFNPVPNIEFYILKSTKDGLVPTYTIPTPLFLVKKFGYLNTILMLPNEYAPSSGKSHLIVLTFQYDEQSNKFVLFSGATAKVYDKNNNLISGYTIKYIKMIFDQNGDPIQIQLVDSPSNDTYGYIVYNLPPSIYFVSAQKSGNIFNTRPVFTFPNSITSGTDIDGVWVAFGTGNLTGKCLDIDNEQPVSGANVSFIGLPGFSSTTSSDGNFTINNIPYPSIGILKISKSGYKNTCYPFLIDENTDAETLMVVSNEGFNKVMNDLNLQPDSTRGNFVGAIFDYYGNSIRNFEIKGLDETQQDSSLTVYYMDSNGEKFDPSLTKTSDHSFFLLPNCEVEKPVYTELALVAKSFYNYGFIFTLPDSIFINMFDFDIQKGNIEIINPGQETFKVVNSNASDVVALKFNLNETTNYENINLQTDTIIIKDIGTGDISKVSAKLVLDANKNGQYDEGEPTVNGVNSDRKFEFNPNWSIPSGSSINLLVLYSFNNATAGDEYKASIQKNSDITGWGSDSDLEVSVDGAPVLGEKITILTQGAPDISVDPSSYNFGSIKVGEESDVLTIGVLNAGTENLVINGSIQVSGDTSDYQIVSDGVSGATISSGSSKTIQVKFKPQSNGTKTIQIKIYSNDPDENPVNINLEGEGYGGLPGGGGGGGCFIATACFGNYNHPIVRVLREFRDKYLMKNRIGKSFVRWYYLHSPKYAKIIENNLFLKVVVKALLYPVYFVILLFLNGLLFPLILFVSLLGVYFFNVHLRGGQWED
ncbi:MAG: CFI-box-CTERM domain-containing protein [Candidatus Ratteibacteria bacterium]